MSAGSHYVQMMSLVSIYVYIAFMVSCTRSSKYSSGGINEKSLFASQRASIICEASYCEALSLYTLLNDASQHTAATSCQLLTPSAEKSAKSVINDGAPSPIWPSKGHCLCLLCLALCFIVPTVSRIMVPAESRPSNIDL